jgi:transcriptional regulator with XRE-family HTH domain
MGLFSKNLRFLRKQRELRQEEIARLFNKRANTVGNWENEKSEPNLSELASLGEYFNISLQELLHVDLEIEKASVSSLEVRLPEKKLIGNKMDDSVAGITNEGVGQSSETILFALRALNEKLDKLADALISSGIRHSDDKSNH